MSDRVNILKRVHQFDKSPQFDGYTKVVLTVADDIVYTSGSDTGRTLDIKCPWGNQQVADNILERIQGFQYQPYEAKGAFLDPSVELGDGVAIDYTYGGVYEQCMNFNALCLSDIKAPEDEEIEHEIPYMSRTNREIKRTLGSFSAELSVQSKAIKAEVAQRQSEVESISSSLELQAGIIEAKVDSVSGAAESFGWKLLKDSFNIYANGTTVLSVDKSGATVQGEIIATSGKIGGFDIGADYLSYNNTLWGSANTVGGYLGIEGLQLGQNFRVDMRGNLTALSGTFGGITLAKNVDYGGDSGYFNGAGLVEGSVSGGWGGEIASGTISTANTVGGINTSLGYANFSHDVFNNHDRADNIGCRTLNISSKYISLDSGVAQWVTKKIGGTTIKYLGRP